MAGKYCALLKRHLGSLLACEPGDTEDGSRSGDPRRKRDLEGTFLWFAIQTNDGQFHDDRMLERFRVALLRAGQAWEQADAKERTRRRDSGMEKFRQRLADLPERIPKRLIRRHFRHSAGRAYFFTISFAALAPLLGWQQFFRFRVDTQDHLAQDFLLLLEFQFVDVVHGESPFGFGGRN